jgi:hypothetical protein
MPDHAHGAQVTQDQKPYRREDARQERGAWQSKYDRLFCHCFNIIMCIIPRLPVTGNHIPTK